LVSKKSIVEDEQLRTGSKQFHITPPQPATPSLEGVAEDGKEKGDKHRESGGWLVLPHGTVAAYGPKTRGKVLVRGQLRWHR
jgi:hypothetical protein